MAKAVKTKGKGGVKASPKGKCKRKTTVKRKN
jgi:hypothetical protein